MKRRNRILLQLALTLGVSALALEGVLRLLLFNPRAASWSAAGRLRKPERFADPFSEDLYWQLSNLWSVQAALQRSGGDPAKLGNLLEPPVYDPLLGWVGVWVSPGEYDHMDRRALKGRRPVLLYGDSFANCMTPPEDCFQGLFQGCALARDHALLNYGMGGYGLDQIYLLLQHSIERYAHQRPIVIVSFLVDDDLDRSLLSFRGWAKPRFSSQGGRLALEEPRVPTRDQYFERHELEAGSFAWRLLVHGTDLLPQGWRRAFSGQAQRAEQIRTINRSILAAITDELRGRGLDFFFLLFFSEPAFSDPDLPAWREEFACQALRELDAPMVSTRRALLAHSEATGHPIGDYFQRTEPGAGHYNALGNAAAFDAIRAGIEGRFDLPEAGRVELPLTGSGLPEPPMPARKVLRGAGATARLEARASDGGPGSGLRLLLRAGTRGPTEVCFELQGKAAALRARPAYSGEALRSAARALGRMRLRVLADGVELLLLELDPVRTPEPLRVDLRGRATLQLVLDDGGDGTECDGLLLDDLVLDPADGH